MSILYIRDKDGNFVQVPSIPGKSAYEIAVEKGTFNGTEQEFAEMQVIENKDIIDQITQENIDMWNSIVELTERYNSLLKRVIFLESLHEGNNNTALVGEAKVDQCVVY